MKIGSFRRRALIGVGAATVIGSATWLTARWAARGPQVTAPMKADVPPIVFERSLPCWERIPTLAWTTNSAVAVSLPPIFRLQNFTGAVVEQYSDPQISGIHAILSDHEIITQPIHDDSILFEVYDLSNGHLLFQEADPFPHNRHKTSKNATFAVRADKSVVAVGYGSLRPDLPVALYSTTTWQTLANVPLPSLPARSWSLMLSNDGKRLAYNAEDAVMVIDVVSGAVVQRLPIPLAKRFAFSPDGEMLAVAERGVVSESNGYKHQVAVALRVFRLLDGTETARRTQTKTASVTAIEWDPRGRFVAYLDGGGPVVHLWNLHAASDQEVLIQLRSEAVGGLVLSPDGGRLAVGDGFFVDLFRIGA